MRPSVSYVCAIAVGGVLSANSFTTPVAERPDEPVPSGAMPADWREYPFVDAVAEPSFTAREREDGFLVFSRPITEPVYRETRPQAGERVESLHAFAARGERAQLNFAVYPGRDIVGFAAVAETPFAARLEQVTYAPFVYDHYQVRGKYRVGPAYLVPSARTPLRRGEPLRYVLTMRVPKDAAPGRRRRWTSSPARRGRGVLCGGRCPRRRSIRPRTSAGCARRPTAASTARYPWTSSARATPPDTSAVRHRSWQGWPRGRTANWT